MIVPDLVKAVTDGQKKARDEIQGKCFMNKRLQELYIEASEQFKIVQDQGLPAPYQTRAFAEKFAELIVAECINREELLGAIARGWCSEKNSHKTMDPDLAVAIFDEVEQQIRQQFGVE